MRLRVISVPVQMYFPNLSDRTGPSIPLIPLRGGGGGGGSMHTMISHTVFFETWNEHMSEFGTVSMSVIFKIIENR